MANPLLPLLRCVLLGAVVGANTPVMASPAHLAFRRPKAAPQTPSSSKSARDPELDAILVKGERTFRQDDYPGAKRIFQDGLKRAEAKKDVRRAAGFCNRLGAVCALQGDYTQAEIYFKRALKLMQDRDDTEGIADSLYNLGKLNMMTGQFEAALDNLLQSLALRRKQGAPRPIANSLESLATLYDHRGQFEAAQENYERALALYRKLNAEDNMADCLLGLGVVQDHLGRLGQSLDAFNHALSIYEKLNNAYGVANTLDQIGKIYYEQGQYDRALQFHTRALPMEEKIGNPEDIATCLDNLGNAYSDAGQLQQALKYYLRALQYDRKDGNPADIASSLDNVGDTYDDLGRYDEALRYFKEALALREHGSNTRDLAFTYRSLGHLYLDMKRYSEALDYSTRALGLVAKLQNQQDLTDCFTLLGIVHQKMDRYDLAEQSLQQAVAAFEAAGDELVDAGQPGAWQQKQPDLYARYALLLLHRGRNADALVAVERGRGRALARQAIRNQIRFTPILGAQDAERLKQCEQQLTVASRLRRALQEQLDRADPAMSASLSAQMKKADRSYEEAEQSRSLLRDALLARSPEYRRIKGQEPPTLEQMQALAQRHPDTLYLEYAVVSENSTLLLALSDRDGLRSYTLPADAEHLQTLVSKWRNAVLQGLPTEPAQASALFQALFAPLQKDGLLAPGRYARLVIAPDGPLRDVPFAALRESGGGRLVERFALANTLSLGVLTWPVNPRLPAASLLCVADPVAPAGELAMKRQGYGPLPHARSEARQVCALFPGALDLIGSEAREETVRRALPRYAMLHFATHGILEERDSLRSALLLTAEPPQSREDGLLEAREITDLPLAAQLAVLSACNSARGRQSGGEGLVGLAWAFRAAGCPSIVASQWAVDDEATQRLMVAFYRGVKAGRPLDTALQQAMLLVRAWVRKTRGGDPPFFWASFQLIGEATPIRLTKQSAGQ